MQTSLLIFQQSDWMGQLACYGYPGVFLLSLIGSLSIVFPIPYTIVIYMLGPLLDPFLIALSGGLGSAMGEAIGYALGYFGRSLLSEERRRKMDYMLKIFSRYGFIMIFLFALTPLPDDLLIVPLGIMHYNPVKFFIPCLAGKTLMCLILALGGRFSISIIRSVLGNEGSWVANLAVFLILVLIVIFMLKIDWEKIFFKYFEKKETSASQERTSVNNR